MLEEFAHENIFVYKNKSYIWRTSTFNSKLIRSRKADAYTKI